MVRPWCTSVQSAGRLGGCEAIVIISLGIVRSPLPLERWPACSRVGATSLELVHDRVDGVLGIPAVGGAEYLEVVEGDLGQAGAQNCAEGILLRQCGSGCDLPVMAVMAVRPRVPLEMLLEALLGAGRARSSSSIRPRWEEWRVSTCVVVVVVVTTAF